MSEKGERPLGFHRGIHKRPQSHSFRPAGAQDRDIAEECGLTEGADKSGIAGSRDPESFAPQEPNSHQNQLNDSPHRDETTSGNQANVSSTDDPSSQRTSDLQTSRPQIRSVLFQPRNRRIPQPPPETPNNRTIAPESRPGISPDLDIPKDARTGLPSFFAGNPEAETEETSPDGSFGSMPFILTEDEKSMLDATLAELQRRDSNLQYEEPQKTRASTPGRFFRLFVAGSIVVGTVAILWMAFPGLRAKLRPTPVTHPAAKVENNAPPSNSPAPSSSSSPQSPASAAQAEVANEKEPPSPPASTTVTVYSPAAPHSKTPAASASETANSEEESAPVLEYRIPPQYPKSARDAGLEGDVVLKVLVGEDGTVRRITPVRGPEILILAAVPAVQQWRYRPKLVKGVPVQAEVSVVLNFSRSKKNSFF